MDHRDLKTGNVVSNRTGTFVQLEGVSIAWLETGIIDTPPYTRLQGLHFTEDQVFGNIITWLEDYIYTGVHKVQTMNWTALEPGNIVCYPNEAYLKLQSGMIAHLKTGALNEADSTFLPTGPPDRVHRHLPIEAFNAWINAFSSS